MCSPNISLPRLETVCPVGISGSLLQHLDRWASFVVSVSVVPTVMAAGIIARRCDAIFDIGINYLKILTRFGMVSSIACSSSHPPRYGCGHSCERVSVYIVPASFMPRSGLGSKQCPRMQKKGCAKIAWLQDSLMSALFHLQSSCLAWN